MRKFYALLEEKSNWLLNITIIFLCNYLTNGWIKFKCLYLDDLSIWQIFNSNTSIDFLLNSNSAKFRPVLNFVLLICFKTIGNKFYIFYFINILLSFFIASFLCYLVKKLTKSNIVSLCISCMFTLSHFIYYNISQVFGIMEALALLLAVILLYFLIMYIDNKKANYYLYAEIVFLFLPYIHERYIVLFPLFIVTQIIYCLLCKTYKIKINIVKHLIKSLYIPLANVLIFFAIRIFFIKDQILAGTGGSSITSTFNLKQTLIYIISQIAYIFGFNAGETYLNGINIHYVSPVITVFIIVSDIMILFITYQFIKVIINDRLNRIMYLCNSLIYITFIMLCIISSSITIRLEMRWIYISYTAALIFLGYMTSVIMSSKSIKMKNIKSLIPIILIFIFILAIPRETYYKSYYKNLYFWGSMELYNSLYEETYEKYGEQLWGKRIIIMDNKNYGITKELMLSYFQQYNPEITASNFDLNVVNNYYDIIQLKNDNSMLFIEKDNDFGFYNATGIINNLQLSNGQIIERKGYDTDNWVQKQAEFTMYTETGKFILNCNFPFEYDGTQSGILYINDQEYCKYTMENPVFSIPIETAPKSIIIIRFDNNFSVKSGADVRELCFTMEITN